MKSSSFEEQEISESGLQKESLYSKRLSFCEPLLFSVPTGLFLPPDEGSVAGEASSLLASVDMGESDPILDEIRVD